MRGEGGVWERERACLLLRERERERERTIIVLRLLSNGSINTKFRSGCAEDNEDSVSRNAVSICVEG